MTDENQNVLIIDNGSHYCKIGFQKEEFPRMNVPFYYKKYPENSSYTFFPNKIEEPFDNIYSFIQNQKVQNWEALENFYQFIFTEELKTNLKQNPILFNLQNPYNFEYKKKLIELFFEKFQVPYFFMAQDALLNLYACGKISGIIVESGHSQTQVTSIFDGAIVPYATKLQFFSGKNLSEILMKKFNINFFQAEELKKNHLRFSREYEQEKHNILNPNNITPLKEVIRKKNQPEIEIKQNITLPDGREISFGTEMIDCSEILLYPHLANLSYRGIQDMLYESLLQIEGEQRRELIQHVVLAGGTVKIYDFKHRFKKAVEDLIPTILKVSCFQEKDPINSCWKGGNILTNLGTFSNMWISRTEYDECGATILESKCLQLIQSNQLIQMKFWIYIF